MTKSTGRRGIFDQAGLLVALDSPGHKLVGTVSLVLHCLQQTRILFLILFSSLLWACELGVEEDLIQASRSEDVSVSLVSVLCGVEVR